MQVQYPWELTISFQSMIYKRPEYNWLVTMESKLNLQETSTNKNVKLIDNSYYY